MPAPDRTHALDHIVVVRFEDHSLDNLLGHLYRPGDGKRFDGVIDKRLTNPIPAWAEHGAERNVVPYTVATDMDSPDPDSGEEFYSSAHRRCRSLRETGGRIDRDTPGEY
jgi:phospholipase C